MEVKTFGVIGSGQMGNGIAQVVAMSGLDVIMNDIKDEFDIAFQFFKKVYYSLGGKPEKLVFVTYSKIIQLYIVNARVLDGVHFVFPAGSA